MISEAIKHAVFDSEALHKYKVFEYDVYKGFHRIVMEDEGVPTLKKRAFEMPGYKKIMDDDARDMYVQAAYKQYENKTHVHLKAEGLEEYCSNGDKSFGECKKKPKDDLIRRTTKSSVLLQDIVPIDMTSASITES